MLLLLGKLNLYNFAGAKKSSEGVKLKEPNHFCDAVRIWS